MDDTSQTLASAVQYHQAGRIAEAERLYREILARQPAHPDALHLLGVAALQQGRLAEALELISRAVAAAPGNADYLNHLGTVYSNLQQWDQAADTLRRAVAANPNAADAHYNLGTAYVALQQWKQAADSFHRALDINSNAADAHYNLGLVERKLGQSERAVESFQRAVALDPTWIDAHYSLGNAWKDLRRFEAAELCYREAIRRQPGFVNAWNNLGNVLHDQGRLDEAVAALRQAVELQPDFALGHDNLGAALSDLGRFEEAIACFNQALAIDPKLADAHNNLGTTLEVTGALDAALACYEQAVQLNPQPPDAHFNRARIWLYRGDFEAGWPEYEWRLKLKGFAPFAGPQPRWDGSPLKGRTILLLAEQGLGDTLQFVRYAKLVQERGGRVLLQCQPQLVHLLKRLPGVETLLPVGAALPKFDLYASLLSLPGIFRTTFESIPNHVPYLAADPQLVEQWRQRFESMDGFKIGIVWQGNPKDAVSRFRFIPLAAFRPLAEVPGIRLFSLQKGFGSEQLAAERDRIAVVELGPSLDEAAGPFMDTAAVMKNLDLVIAPDTAAVHLAGALGVAVWVALSVAPDWRWFVNREDCPWYPTMRVFRQRKPGDWDDVFRRMAAVLEPMAAR